MSSLCNKASCQIGDKTKRSRWAHFLQTHISLARRISRQQGGNLTLLDNHNEEEIRHNDGEEDKHIHEDKEENMLTDDDELAALWLDSSLEVSVVGTPGAGGARTRRHLRLR